jgi:hypothetical protein
MHRLEADTSFARRRVIRVLDAALRQRAWPQRIRCKSGPESHHAIYELLYERRIELRHVQPGRTMPLGLDLASHSAVRTNYEGEATR